MNPQALEQSPEVQHAIAAVDDLDAFAKAYEVATAQQYEDGAAYLRSVKQAAATLEATRTGFTKPLNESLKRINDFFRKPVERLAQIERIIKGKLLSYAQEQERRRADAQAKLDATAAAERNRLEAIASAAAAKGQEAKADKFAERAQTVVAPIAQVETPKVTGLAMRDNWTFEIVDESKIPRRFLCVDHKKIGAYVRSLKADAAADLPGVRVYNDKLLASGKAGAA